VRIGRVLKAKDLREGDSVMADDGRWLKVEEVTQAFSDSFDQRKKAGVWVRLDAFEPEYLRAKERVLVLR
jgi:hypothetical protein